jgi:tRNA1Val (adenine37-N6)-methyltransferase
MSNQSFAFKQFIINQDKCAFKVGTDSVLLGAWVNASSANSILDIGTGTGIIALMLAQKSTAEIDAIDIDENACNQATENVELSNWKNRITISQTSIQHLAENAAKKYDLIVTNPPYFVDSTKASEEKRTLARHDDLMPRCELIEAVINLIDKKGKFCIILPFKEAEQFREMAEQKKLHLNKLMRVKTRADKSTDKRMMMQFGLEQKTFSESTIVIENNNRHEYSDEYKELTKDYYLAF